MSKTLAKSYLPLLSDEIIDTIKNELENDRIWISTDETTDIKGRHVTNVIIGPLNPEKKNKSYLIDSKFVPKADNINVYLTVMTALSLLWPKGVNNDKVLLFITDAASYMMTTANNLKQGSVIRGQLYAIKYF